MKPNFIKKTVTVLLKTSLTIIPLIIIGCEKDKPVNNHGIDTCQNSVAATIKRYHLNGCTWLIEINDTTRLEATNLYDFNIEIEDRKKIWLTYEMENIFKSICMAGQGARIKCMAERK